MQSDKPIKHRLEYLGLLLLERVVCSISVSTLLALSRSLGTFGFRVLRLRRSVTLGNLRRVYPHRSERWRRKIALRTYQNFSRTFLEYLRIRRFSPEALRELVQFETDEPLEAALRQGKGALVYSGHFGNWEYLGVVLGVKGYPMHSIYRAMHNPLADEMVVRNRRKFGGGAIPVGQAYRGALRVLKRAGFVAIVVDQDAGPGGVWVDFLGQKSSAASGPALLALRSGAPLILTLALPRPDGSFRATAETVHIDDIQGTQEERVQAITQRVSERLERYIRRYPTNWFWMHRRWKTPPPEEAVSVANSKPGNSAESRRPAGEQAVAERSAA